MALTGAAAIEYVRFDAASQSLPAAHGDGLEVGVGDAVDFADFADLGPLDTAQPGQRP